MKWTTGRVNRRFGAVNGARGKGQPVMEGPSHVASRSARCKGSSDFRSGRRGDVIYHGTCIRCYIGCAIPLQSSEFCSDPG
jgi:hypothetical protein